MALCATIFGAFCAWAGYIAGQEDMTKIQKELMLYKNYYLGAEELLDSMYDRDNWSDAYDVESYESASYILRDYLKSR